MGRSVPPYLAARSTAQHATLLGLRVAIYSKYGGDRVEARVARSILWDMHARTHCIMIFCQKLSGSPPCQGFRMSTTPARLMPHEDKLGTGKVGPHQATDMEDVNFMKFFGLLRRVAIQIEDTPVVTHG